MTFFEGTDDLTGEVIEVFVSGRDIAELPPAGQVFILLLYGCLQFSDVHSCCSILSG